jgi:hypothetical protein
MKRVLASLGTHFLKCPVSQFEELQVVAEVEVCQPCCGDECRTLFTKYLFCGHIKGIYLKTFTTVQVT